MSESPGHRPRSLTPTAYLLMMTFRAWLIEVPVAALNAFVLMDLVYAPRFGTLVAHQIGMFTRIAIILLFAYFIAYFAGEYTARSLLLAGVFWVTPIWTFVITVTAASVVFGWVGNHTGGSVVPALLLHTTMNLGFWLSPVLYTAAGPYWVMVLFVFAVAAIALLDRQTMLRPAHLGPVVPSC